jgi:hypothetical protein
MRLVIDDQCLSGVILHGSDGGLGPLLQLPGKLRALFWRQPGKGFPRCWFVI